jgi:uncharacterized repeat protein (TIGR01451 family)
MRTLFKVILVVALCLSINSVVWAAPSPVLTITASPFPFVVNQGARVTIVATNNGPDNADNVVITNAVPNNMGIANVTTTQGNIHVYNSAITVYAGTLGPGQAVTVYVDVVVVAAYPSDAPFQYCTGLTYLNGTARLSCLPNQPAISRPGRVPLATLAPNGQRPIYDPNRPPVFLPVSGSPIDPGSLYVFLGGAALVVAMLIKRRR